jgi:hypothetical protein
LPAGQYNVAVKRAGFDALTRQLELQISQVALADFQLIVGQVTSSVTISAGSPVADAVNSSLGEVIEGRQVTELPLNGRNFTQLTTLVPGVTRGIPTGAATGTQNNTETFRYSESGGGSVSVNGLPPQANNFLFDGIDNNETLVNTIIFFTQPDALQEFRVITNAAPAEFGRASGGVITSTLKSGTNLFHGSAFWFHRDESLDSKFFFASGDKPVFARDQFGGTLGGPIVKDKLFFFLDYQGLRLNQPQGSSVGTVPTALMRTGNFSELLCGATVAGVPCPSTTGLGTSVVIKDPTTGLPFAGNIIPMARQNTVGLAYLNQTHSSGKLHPYCPVATEKGSWGCALPSSDGGGNRGFRALLCICCELLCDLAGSAPDRNRTLLVVRQCDGLT